MRRAIGYVRVSTGKQALSGVSLEAQEARIKAWCTANEFEFGGVHVDAGLSGGRADNRPALQDALAEVGRVKGVLVVYSLSRLARSTRDTIEIADRLEKAGADLVSLSEHLDTTSAAGRMVFRLLAVLAEFERDQISERVTACMGHLRAKERRISGKIPFGWAVAADGKALVRVPAELAVVENMKAMRKEGRGLREIARALEAAGIATKEDGGAWTATSVRRILARAQ